MSVLGISAGTDGVTAVVVAADGSITASGHQLVEQHRPHDGWVEQSPDEIWRATVAATRAAVADHSANGGPEIRGIGISNQHDTVVLWDRETLGTPRPAISGADRRTAEVCASMREAGQEGRVREITGRRFHPGLLGPTLSWLAEHEPNTWTLVRSGRYAVGTVDSYLVARLTRGTWHVTDVSNASRSLLLDLGSAEWSAELCTLFEVPLDALPEIVPSWGRVGISDPRSFVGLELPIAGIGGDHAATLFGHGCFDVGDAALGTGSVVLANTGGSLLREEGELRPLAAWSAANGTETYAVEGSVEAFRTLSSVTSLAVDGSTDDVLCRALADTLGIVVARSATVGTAAVGAAFLAGLGVGMWAAPGELGQVLRLDRRFRPRP